MMMISTNKQVLDEVFQVTDSSLNTTDTEKKEEKTKPHELRRNIEDYLERKALERKLLDIYDDDFPLD